MKRLPTISLCLGLLAGCGSGGGLCPEEARRCNGAVLEVPQTYHGQAYLLELAGVDKLLTP